MDDSNQSHDFVIDCVAWHTQRPGMEGMEEETRLIYGTLIRFLQDNCLTTRKILPEGVPVTDDVAIRESDLTHEGSLLMSRPYDRWLGAIDHGQPPTDTKILERALVKIRSGSVGKYGE